jgi:hypothetical protein
VAGGATSRLKAPRGEVPAKTPPQAAPPTEAPFAGLEKPLPPAREAVPRPDGRGRRQRGAWPWLLAGAGGGAVLLLGILLVIKFTRPDGSSSEIRLETRAAAVAQGTGPPLQTGPARPAAAPAPAADVKPPPAGPAGAPSESPPSPFPSGDGFVPLFNGKDLGGWSIDGPGGEKWAVEQGIIVARGDDFRTRDYLLSDRDYADFVLRLEYSLDKGAAGGIAVRAFPGERLPYRGAPIFEHPLFKLVDTPHGEETGTTRWVRDSADVKPDRAADQRPSGEWNRLEIEVKGRTFRASVNGKPVFSTTLAASALLPDGSVPALNRPKGRISLQKHTGTVRFRQIEIKELPAPAPGPTPEPEKPFAPLFNGKDLTGWSQLTGQPARWKVVGDVLEVVPKAGDIMTTRTFGPDFRLRAEFRIPYMPDRKGQARGNSGIFLLGRHEIQIVDDVNNDAGPPEACCGALYGVIGPGKHVTRPPGQWQDYDIEYHAPRFDAAGRPTQPGRLTVVFNGTRVIDDAPFTAVTTSGRPPLSGPASTGPIILQEHDAPVQFRKIEIKELPPAKPR